MKVVLRSDVDKVGRKGDVVTVSDGYARNYLVPRGLALRATDGAVAQATAMRRARELSEARDRESADEMAERLRAVSVSVPAKAGGEGRLFGSITASDIASAVESAANVELDRRKVHLDEPIKTLGSHEVVVRLHSEVEVRLVVEVVAQAQ